MFDTGHIKTGPAWVWHVFTDYVYWQVWLSQCMVQQRFMSNIFRDMWKIKWGAGKCIIGCKSCQPYWPLILLLILRTGICSRNRIDTRHVSLFVCLSVHPFMQPAHSTHVHPFICPSCCAGLSFPSFICSYSCSSLCVSLCLLVSAVFNTSVILVAPSSGGVCEVISWSIKNIVMHSWLKGDHHETGTVVLITPSHVVSTQDSIKSSNFAQVLLHYSELTHAVSNMCQQKCTWKLEFSVFVADTTDYQYSRTLDQYGKFHPWNL